MKRSCSECAFRDYKLSDFPCSYCEYDNWCPIGVLDVREEQEL